MTELTKKTGTFTLRYFDGTTSRVKGKRKGANIHSSDGIVFNLKSGKYLFFDDERSAKEYKQNHE